MARNKHLLRSGVHLQSQHSERLRQEICKFEPSLGNLATPCLKRKERVRDVSQVLLAVTRSDLPLWDSGYQSMWPNCHLHFHRSPWQECDSQSSGRPGVGNTSLTRCTEPMCPCRPSSWGYLLRPGLRARSQPTHPLASWGCDNPQPTHVLWLALTGDFDLVGEPGVQVVPGWVQAAPRQQPPSGDVGADREVHRGPEFHCEEKIRCEGLAGRCRGHSCPARTLAISYPNSHGGHAD